LSNHPVRVSIGLPTYNRPDLLQTVIDGFRRQSFANFELIVSDNASTDHRVTTISEQAAALDPRIRYVRHESNIGPEANFWSVFDRTSAPLFLWASDDDVWPADFLEKAVAALEADPGAGAWFCQVANINIDGRPARDYPSFARFQSSGARALDLVRFLWEPEVMGKANLIYSVYRRERIAEVIELFRTQAPSWGSDMNLVYAFLCRNRILVDDGVLFLKRVPVDVVPQVDVPRDHIYPLRQRGTYFGHYRRVAVGTPYAVLTYVTLAVRGVYDFWHLGRRRVVRELRKVFAVA